MVGSVSDRHRIGRIGRIGDELSLDEIGKTLGWQQIDDGLAD